MENDINSRTISAEKLSKKLSAANDTVLIDTLPGDHFNEVHIPGAINVCVFEVSFTENIKKIVPDKNKEIIVYGSSSKSMDALTAAEKMARVGYRNVFALEGGLKHWLTSGMKFDGKVQLLSNKRTNSRHW